jgi:hypothetical protein
VVKRPKARPKGLASASSSSTDDLKIKKGFLYAHLADVTNLTGRVLWNAIFKFEDLIPRKTDPVEGAQPRFIQFCANEDMKKHFYRLTLHRSTNDEDPLDARSYDPEPIGFADFEMTPDPIASTRVTKKPAIDDPPSINSMGNEDGTTKDATAYFDMF